MMFASKSPRDLNHDPEPWQGGVMGGRASDELMRRREAMTFQTGWHYNPRPEFDHVQHNAPNPILTYARQYLNREGDKAYMYGVWRDALLFRGPFSEDVKMLTPTSELMAHARRVLGRLASLAEKESRRMEINKGDKVRLTRQDYDTVVTGTVTDLHELAGVGFIVLGGADYVADKWDVEVIERAHQLPTQAGVYVEKVHANRPEGGRLFKLMSDGKWREGDGSEGATTFAVAKSIHEWCGLVRLVAETEEV